MVDTIVELVARVNVLLYFLCGLGFLLGLRSLSMSRRLRKVAVFSLEREAARNLRRRALSTIGSMIALAGSIYIVANVVRPALQAMPVAGDDLSVATTITPTPQTTATPRPLLFPTVTPTFGIVAPGESTPAGPSPTPPAAGEPGECLLGVKITNPLPGEVVAGQVQVLGEANILDFDSYKFEVNGPSTGSAWATVSTFTIPVARGFLGTWDATSLEPGSYLFRLVVVDASGNFPTPCEIPITIASPAARPGPTQTPVAP